MGGKLKILEIQLVTKITVFKFSQHLLTLIDLTQLLMAS